jgi:uncharacterized protein DUF4349
MSQRDLVTELRGSRIPAPPSIREQVRLIAASAATPPRRRLTWRRALVVALPVAAAVAASIVFTRPDHHNRVATPSPVADSGETRALRSSATPKTFSQSGTAATKLAPQPSAGRAQRYGADLTLRVATPNRVSDGVKRALQIASSLGGYPTSVHASSKSRAASADLVLRVPRSHVQDAIRRLSALGTITAERVDVEDVQAGLNAADRTIERLQRELRTLRAEKQTPQVEQRIRSITARVERLQRQAAAAIRATRFATIQLHLQTPQAAAPHHHGNGPLHGLGVAFRWIGIGAIYALALGLPLAVLLGLAWFAARTVRRRREDALLSSR